MAERTISTKEELKQILKQAEQERWTDFALVKKWFDDEELPEKIQEEHKFWVDVDIRFAIQQISKLTNLSSLALPKHLIGDDGAETLTALTNLSSLNLSSNGIGDEGTEALSKLTNLSSLALFHNDIGDEGVKVLSKLANLSFLDLGDNEIGDQGTEVLSKLTNLSSLALRFNRIGDEGAKALSKLTNLSSLDLDRNNIGDEGCRALLDAFLDNTTIQTLNLRHNSTTEQFLPPEILSQGDAQKILAAYRSHKEAKKKGQLKPLNEVKLLIVGNEAVGKTSLVRALVQGKTCNTSEAATPGIVLQKIETKQWKEEAGVTINIWDFGGQEVMHGTHRFFLTSRSLYLLVLSDRLHDDHSVYDWLETVTSRAGDVPIIVVINKSDKEPYGLFLNESGLRKDFPSIIAFLRTSCSESNLASIEKLKKLTTETIQTDERLKHIRNPIPDSWRRIKNALSVEAQRKKRLRNDEFVALCLQGDNLAITDSDEQQALRSLLHDLGVIIIHEDTADKKELKLLDPNWLTTAIYMLINDHRVKQNHGIFSYQTLVEILPSSEYTDLDYGYIVSMMKDTSLELCFQLPEKAQYLIPEALSKNEPQPAEITLWSSGALLFRCEYKFLPQGLLPRLIVRLHTYLNPNQPRWRTGMILMLDRCEVLVYGNKQEKTIDIKITGPSNNRRFALWIVLNELDKLHGEYKSIEASKVVPLSEQFDLSVPYGHLLELESEEGLDHSFKPYRARRKYTVRELLEGVRSPSKEFKQERSMAETHFLDELPFDWSRPESQGLLQALSKAYDRPDGIRFLIQTVKGVDIGDLNFEGSPQTVWRRAIDVISKQGHLRNLIEQALRDQGVRAFHPRLKELLSGAKPSAAVTVSTVNQTKPAATEVYHVGIITMKEEEFEAALDKLKPSREKAGKNRDYDVADIETSKGKCSVAITRCVQQGNSYAQSTANEMISDLSPRFIIVVGIAGGIPTIDFCLGDVVVSDFIQDLNLEDTGSSPENRKFNALGEPLLPAASRIVERLKSIERKSPTWSTSEFIVSPRPSLDGKHTTQDKDWNDDIDKALKNHANKTAPKATAKKIASSDRLVKDPELLQTWRKVLKAVSAVEMESAGAYIACQRSNVPFLAIRGISDIVGWRRDEAWTLYACHTAAAYTRMLIESGVFCAE
jgi:small GTP-binding protein